MKILKIAFMLIIISPILTLLGCGQTGPLYLPKPQPPTHAQTQ